MPAAGTVTAYEWRAGARLRGSAQAAGEAIDKIAAKNGGVCSPHDLVAAARRPRHACHGMFEWDDEVAAHGFRLVQARQIIRSIRVVAPEADDDDGRSSPPAFLHVRGATTEGYMSTDAAMASDDLRALVLGEALAHLRGLQSRYDHLAELAAVWAALEEVAG